MARLSLDKNKKLDRLAMGLNAIAPGMGRLLARGILETLWGAAYEQADENVGDHIDVANAAGWPGDPLQLVELLHNAGGTTRAGFIDVDSERGGYKLHDFWEHAPGWVKVKAQKNAAREAAGKSISEMRREAGRAGRAKQLAAAPGAGNGQTAGKSDDFARTDAGKTRAKTRNGTGRDGTGFKSLAEPKALRPHGGDTSTTDETHDGADGGDDVDDTTTTRPTAPLTLLATVPEKPTLTRPDALAAIATASGGLFVASQPSKGGVFKLDKLRKLPDAVARLERIGRWLAAGGDWRTAKGQKLDGRHVGELDAWDAQAQAWTPGTAPAAPARASPASPPSHERFKPRAAMPREPCPADLLESPQSPADTPPATGTLAAPGSRNQPEAKPVPAQAIAETA